MLINMATTRRTRQGSGSSDRLEKRQRVWDENLLCAGCSCNLSDQPYSTLIDGRYNNSNHETNGCSHRQCMVCFGLGHANRGAGITIGCPNYRCSYETRKWTIRTTNNNRSGDGHNAPEQQEIPKPTSDSDRDMRPVLYYQYQDRTYQQNFSILSLVTSNPDNPNNPNYYVSELKKGDNNTDIDRKDILSLEAIGQSLHPCLIPPPKHDTYSTSQCAYANKHSATQLERNDNTPLRALVHGIAVGDRFFKEGDNDGRGNQMEQREYNASYAATDLIRTAKGGCRRGSKFKDLISDHLNIAGVE